MKNICFIANYYKTDVFVEIAKILEQHNIYSYWIIPNRKQYETLKNIFSEDKLLYIGKKEVLESNVDSFSYDLKINELVYGDRVLRHESAKWKYTYLHKLGPLYFNFLKKNNISYIFGEATWAHELVAHRLTLKAKSLNCSFLSPQTVRIPNGRFAFLEDEFLSLIKEESNGKSLNYNSIQVEKPSYLALNDTFLKKKGTLKYNIILLKNFIFRTNQDANDPTLYENPLTQFKIRVSEIYNRFLFKKIISETQIEDLPKNKKIILFTLHKQPEASVDVNGRYYENQLTLINNIWRILPEDYIFLVKEHSNAIGDRNLRFYRTIKKLPNTYLIDHKEDSHILLDKCEVVFTISGTIAYEAALKEKKAFTFAPTFFNKMSTCMEVSWKDFKNNSLADLLVNNTKGLNINEFSNWLLDNSFDGIMSDSFGDPRCMEKENIARLCKGFLHVIK